MTNMFSPAAMVAPQAAKLTGLDAILHALSDGGKPNGNMSKLATPLMSGVAAPFLQAATGDDSGGMGGMLGMMPLMSMFLKKGGDSPTGDAAAGMGGFGSALSGGILPNFLSAFGG